MAGLEIADLRSVHILRHLTEEEMSAIKSVHVYGTNRSPFDGPSALYVTTKDEVFLAGFDSLVGKSYLDMEPDGWKDVLEKSLKVEELSGKSVRRIVVGEDFGAALTVGNDLYLWGCDVGLKLPAGLLKIALESDYGEAQCSKCLQKLVTDSDDHSLSWCSECGFQNKVSSLPPPSSWIGRPQTVLGLSVAATDFQLPNFFCSSCRVFSECHFVEVDQFKIVVCVYCYRLIDGNQCMISPLNSSSPHKITFPTPLSIVDIAGGRHFLLLQTSLQLIIWGDFGGERYNHAIFNTDNVAFTKVACGSAHIALITDRGDLYTCGVGDDGQLGYTWSSADGCMALKKVPLKSRVVDVACGLKSTVCLLENGARILYGNVNNLVSSSTFSMNLFDSALLCVPTVVSQNYAKVIESAMMKLIRSVDKHLAVLTGDLTDVFVHLHGANATSPGDQIKPGFCDIMESKPSDVKPCDSDISVHLNPNLPHLFGRSLLSDLTLKLADGDFPVHRLALYSSSAYFSQLFSDSKPPSVLDMSSYNPSAYRGLLQYFYGTPLSQMTIQDMFDLYVLATSYKEDSVAANVFTKLKSSINADNVLLLFDKSKAANATKLLQECQEFINAPEFKKSLFERASKSTDVLADILRSLSMS